MANRFNPFFRNPIAAQPIVYQRPIAQVNPPQLSILSELPIPFQRLVLISWNDVEALSSLLALLNYAQEALRVQVSTVNPGLAYNLTIWQKLQDELTKRIKVLGREWILLGPSILKQ